MGCRALRSILSAAYELDLRARALESVTTCAFFGSRENGRVGEATSDGYGLYHHAVDYPGPPV